MSASIRAIDLDSVHRIHSGQVVLDLQGAVKELVENSLDAGATIVDVKIKDHGLESIQVVDNGSGIDSADWPFIGLKHHTSKLPSLSALAQISTFGFRGEAVSSLCALCESVVVVTATKETAPMGAVIKLGRDGRVLDSSSRIARQRGTTITLNGLFSPLPVRRKEFERNAKREFAKALTTLTGYALVPSAATNSTSDSRGGVRLKVEAQAKNGNTVLATNGKGGLRSSVAAVWGARALEGVIDLSLEMEVDVDKAMARREGLTETSQIVRVAGLVSSAAWGQGRSSADRQFFYINSRPCNLPKVAKTINEVYKSFNTNQVPLAILDFQIPKESVDINVSPDKRTIFVHSEDNLVESLRTALEAFFQPTRSSYAISGASKTIKLLQSDLSGVFGVKEETLKVETIAHGLQKEVGSVEEGLEENETTEAEKETEPILLQAEEDVIEDEDENDEGRTNVVVFPELREEDQGQGEIELEDNQLDSDADVDPSQVPSHPSTPAKSTHQVHQTLDTTKASWSPHRRGANSNYSTSSSSSSIKVVKTVGVCSRSGLRGKQARVNLRKSLAGFASQGKVVSVEAEEEDGEEEEEEDEEDEVEVEQEEKQEEGRDQDKVEQGELQDQVEQAKEENKKANGLRNMVDAMDVDMDVEGELQFPPENAQLHGETNYDDDNEDVENSVDDPIPRLVDTINQLNPRERVRSAAEPIFVDEAVSEHLTEADFDEIAQVVESSVGREGNNVMAISSGLSQSLIGLDGDPSSFSPSTSTTMSIGGGDVVKDRVASINRSTLSFRDEIQSSAIQGETTLRFDMDRLRQRYASKGLRNTLNSYSTILEERDTLNRMMKEGRRVIDAGVDNKNMAEAEAALSRVIKKDDFERMEVVGQFNKGFIIARLRDEDGKENENGRRNDDLFIVDQHASDEKFNFETLQRTTVIRAQSLIKPRPIQLTVRDEIVAMENLDVLKANGFEVVVNELAAPGRGERISLAAMPVSRDTTFDIKDLEQLLHLLSDSARPAGQMVRCTKARSMFASRACRKSVMIGKSLTKAQMTQLLRNMGTIDQPWNCPHGRPTMRHLHQMDQSGKSLSRKINWSIWTPSA